MLRIAASSGGRRYPDILMDGTRPSPPERVQGSEDAVFTATALLFYSQ
ncbi:MAG: hypothetical protein LBR47_04305 [Spirochaetaceae bacterium]|nr:hypothetical protein [Spirochaetaceae bacterium]